MKSPKKVSNVIVSVILWIIILLAALYAFVTLATKDDTNIASIAGISPLRVQSDSMKPTFEKGDLIFIKKTDPETLEVGDIVTFHTIIENKYVLNTHRISEIKEENGVRNYITQGDNNRVSDKHIIVGGDIVGKYVTKVPVLGSIMDFISSKVGFLIIIVLPMLLFFIYQVYHLIMVSIELKKATAIEAALEAQKIVESGKDESDENLTDAEKAEAALREAERLKKEAEEALLKAQKAQEALEQTKEEN